MFESGFFNSLLEEEKHENVQRPRTPPKTRQELLQLMGHEDFARWPSGDEEETCLEPGGPAAVIGEISDIKADLMQHAPCVSALDDVDSKLQAMERKMSELASKFLCKPSNSSSTDGEELNIQLKNMVAALQASSDLREAIANKEKYEDGGHVQHAYYPGVSGFIPPLLPKMEPLPVLDQVTKAQNFSASFKREWRRFFFSEASCYILQSFFWWIWLERYKPNPEQQAALFTITADRFVHLIISNTSKLKDELFQHFPRCLAQALFVVFCKAFPNSLKQLHEPEFIQTLCDLSSEWTTGVKSQPDCWQQWPMASLVQSPQLNEGDKSGVVKQPITDIGIPSVTFRPHTARGSVSLPHSSQESKHPKPRHEEDVPSVGPGPTFECVQFGITGKSPLFQHHLRVHQLAEVDRPRGPFISRTQIKDVPPPTVTYKKLITASSMLSQERYKEYMREKKRSNRVIREVLLEHQEAKLALERENKEMLKHRYKVSVAAEQLMTKYFGGKKITSESSTQQNDNQ